MVNDPDDFPAEFFGGPSLNRARPAESGADVEELQQKRRERDAPQTVLTALKFGAKKLHV